MRETIESDKNTKENELLIIGDINSVFVRDLINRLKAKDLNTIKIDAMSSVDTLARNNIMYDKLYMLTKMKNKNNSWIIKIINIFLAGISFLRTLISIKKYNIINIHYVSAKYSFFAKGIRKKANYLILSYWGSDFYRANEKSKKKQIKLIESADIITFTNPSMKNDFLNYYNNINPSKIKVIAFGLEALDEIKSCNENLEKYNKKLDIFMNTYSITPNKIYIVCGYNSKAAQQHIKIINQILLLKKQYTDKCCFVFPMGYGDKEYMNEVESYLLEHGTGIDFVILKSFMNYKDISILRKISDIMIHIQTTDQFSGSMQETLYAGNIVINGAWLDYNILKTEGAFFLEVQNPDELSGQIEYALDNYKDLKDKCRVNPDIIWKVSSWSNNIEKWEELYLDFL